MSDLQADLRKMRTLVQKMGWYDFMKHVSLLMAEQVDKTAGDQSNALLARSHTICALSWDGWEHFTYQSDTVEVSQCPSCKGEALHGCNYCNSGGL